MVEQPGCHGLPTAVSPSSPSCLACPSRASCLFEAGQFLASLPSNPLTQRERKALALTRQALANEPAGHGEGVTTARVIESTRGVKRIVLSECQVDDLSRLAPKVAKQVKSLTQLGWFAFAKTELAAGRNPANKGWRQVLCRLLLLGPFTRQMLVLALVEHLNMTPASAKEKAAIALSIFAAGRLATEQLGQITLSPN